MGAGRALNAWANKGRFTFVGSLELGTKVLHGRGKSFVVPADVYGELISKFAGHEVVIGASRQPPRDSLNAWLRKRLPDVEVPVAYVGPILVTEGAAERDGDALRFTSA